MKLAFAGKGGVGKTSLTSWTADWLARQGKNVWMVDADTALSLGQASGLSHDQLPEALVQRQDIVRERIHEGGFLNLNPEVGDLPETLAVDVPVAGKPVEGIEPGRKRLLVMGGLTNAGGGCACDANALLKALLAHIVMDRDEWVLVDLEAGVEHLGRGTVASVDGLVVVSDPSFRGLETAATVGRMGATLGLEKQLLVVNRLDSLSGIPDMSGLPEKKMTIPALSGLISRQLTSASVLSLPEESELDQYVEDVVSVLSS